MGLLDDIRGVRQPPAGQPVRTAEEVFTALLSVNDPNRPYAVRPGDDGRADVIAEFLVTVRRGSMVGNTYRDHVYRILLRLDPEHLEVRALGTRRETEWWDGPSRTPTEKAFSRGTFLFFGTFIPVERDEEGTLRTMPPISFDSRELTARLIDRVLAGGWMWRPIRGFGKL